MKQITLSRVILKNFRSYKKQCVEFSTTSGLKYIGGQNLVEPKLGSNGAGKSTLLEAICWCSYGSGLPRKAAPGGAKISSLQSWDTDLTEVLTEYLINGELHSIYRSGPPMKIELDGEAVAQEKVDILLGLSKEQFLHSIIFGQGADLFPDLPIPKRGEILDQVLKLEIWERASDNASKKTTSLEKSLLTKKSDLAYVEGQISQLQTEDYISGQIEYWELTHQEELNNCKLDIESWDSERENKLTEIQTQITEWKFNKEQQLSERVTEIETLEAQISNLDGLILELPEKILTKTFSELTSSISDAERNLSSSQQRYTQLETERMILVQGKDFWMQGTCPSCHQVITETQKCVHIRQIEDKEQELTVGMDFNSNAAEDIKLYLEKRRNELLFLRTQSIQTEEQHRSYQREKNRIESIIQGIESGIRTELQELKDNKHPFIKQQKSILVEGNPYVSQLRQLEKRVNPYLSILIENKKERLNLDGKRKLVTEEIKKIESSIIATEYWKHGFKRIRLFFVNQILATLQIEIQSAISALGLEKWSIHLATESLTKSETVKLGVQIHIKSPIAEGEWSVWSGGESQRLRIGIAMGLASLIQRAAGCFYNFEVWDEPTQFLSTEGIEDLLQALEHRSEILKKSIFIIDHRALQSASFKEIWTATKDELGFSHISITATGN